jgi:hypothetical protein
MTQVVLVGITWYDPSIPTLLLKFTSIASFATVGMFSAVTNLGAGGLQDVALSDTANGVLYGMFAITGLISGGINNRTCHIAYTQPSRFDSFGLVLGPRLTLFIVTFIPSCCYRYSSSNF